MILKDSILCKKEGTEIKNPSFSLSLSLCPLSGIINEVNVGPAINILSPSLPLAKRNYQLLIKRDSRGIRDIAAT